MYILTFTAQNEILKHTYGKKVHIDLKYKFESYWIKDYSWVKISSIDGIE